MMDKRAAQTKGCCAVVGAVNVDLRGTPRAPLVLRDSNPGRTTLSLGGVGRNIAHNLSLLGVPVRFLTALGVDSFAVRIEDSCHSLGIDLSDALRVPGGATSTYLFITDHHGDMELAVSDMDIYDRLTPAYLRGKLEVLNSARLVVCDANIPAASLEYLAEHCTAPLFVDPVSTAKAEKLRPILGRLHTLKPNKLEASMLSGIDIHDELSLQLAAGKLLETGLQRVFISLGADGVLCADRTRLRHLPPVEVNMVNANGAGDAFMAALAWAWLEELDLEQSARAGLAASAVSLMGEETINPRLSAQEVRRLAGL